MTWAGFVLTGGSSSRMGRDKALLPWGKSVLVEEIAVIVAQVTDAVALVGRPERYVHLPFDCIPDLRPDFGPLSGIEAALASGRGDLNVIVSCDLAGLQIGWIESLKRAMAPGVLCAFATDRNGKLQPLCAIYRSECLPKVQRAIDDRRLKALDLLKEIAAVPVPVDAVISNLNTPAHIAEWVTIV